MVQFKTTKEQIMGTIADWSERMKPNRPYVVVIKEWRKPRSTGKFSQNNHFYGHCRQIARETDNSVKAVAQHVITLQFEDGRWPAETLPDGAQVPLDERQVDTKVFADAIERIHDFAAEWGIPLIERNWEGEQEEIA